MSKKMGIASLMRQSSLQRGWGVGWGVGWGGTGLGGEDRVHEGQGCTEAEKLFQASQLSFLPNQPAAGRQLLGCSACSPGSPAQGAHLMALLFMPPAQLSSASPATWPGGAASATIRVASEPMLLPTSTVGACMRTATQGEQAGLLAYPASALGASSKHRRATGRSLQARLCTCQPSPGCTRPGSRAAGHATAPSSNQ